MKPIPAHCRECGDEIDDTELALFNGCCEDCYIDNKTDLSLSDDEYDHDLPF